MTKIEVKMAKMETDIQYIKGEVSEVKESLNKFIECADKRYASKLTEQIMYGLCGVILLAVITKLLNVW